MRHVPWPLWMLAAFVGVLFLGGLATELLLMTPTLGGLAWWGVAGIGVFGGGYLWLRRLARAHRPFDGRWEQRVREQADGRDD